MLKPVTPANEVAIDTLERANSPRWPTNITDIICKLYCRKLTKTNGPAILTCLFNSSLVSVISNESFLNSPLIPIPSSTIRGDPRRILESSWSILVSNAKERRRDGSLWRMMRHKRTLNRWLAGLQIFEVRYIKLYVYITDEKCMIAIKGYMICSVAPLVNHITIYIWCKCNGTLIHIRGRYIYIYI